MPELRAVPEAFAAIAAAEARKQRRDAAYAEIQRCFTDPLPPRESEHEPRQRAIPSTRRRFRTGLRVVAALTTLVVIAIVAMPSNINQ